MKALLLYQILEAEGDFKLQLYLNSCTEISGR